MFDQDMEDDVSNLSENIVDHDECNTSRGKGRKISPSDANFDNIN